jgi:hypothetical protein
LRARSIAHQIDCVLGGAVFDYDDEYRRFATEHDLQTLRGTIVSGWEFCRRFHGYDSQGPVIIHHPPVETSG